MFVSMVSLKMYDYRDDVAWGRSIDFMKIESHCEGN